MSENNRSEAEQKRIDEDLELEKQVGNAIYGDGTFPVKAKVGEGDKAREIEVWFKWGDMGDEETITRLTAIYTGGLSQDIISGADYNLARGRAIIEVLAQPTPGSGFPAFLPAGDEAITLPNGKKGYRPDTRKIKSRALILAIFYSYAGLVDRFRHLAFE